MNMKNYKNSNFFFSVHLSSCAQLSHCDLLGFKLLLSVTITGLYRSKTPLQLILLRQCRDLLMPPGMIPSLDNTKNV